MESWEDTPENREQLSSAKSAIRNGNDFDLKERFGGGSAGTFRSQTSRATSPLPSQQLQSLPPLEKGVVIGDSHTGRQADRFVTLPSAHRRGPDGQHRYFDFNFHNTKKHVSAGLLDVALLTANSSQLKHVILAGKAGNDFYEAILVLLSISIFLQILIGCILIWLSRININEADDKGQKQAEVLNNIVVVGIFVLTIFNVFSAAVGISNDY